MKSVAFFPLTLSKQMVGLSNTNKMFPCVHKVYKHTDTYLRSPPPGNAKHSTGVPEWDPPRRRSWKLNGSKFTCGESGWRFYGNSTRPSRNTSSSENRLLSWNKSVIARCAQKVTKQLSDKPRLTYKVPDLVIHTRTPLPLNSRCHPKLPRKKHT